MQTRRPVRTNTHRASVGSSLKLRLVISLLLVAVTLAIRTWKPEFLEPLRGRLLENSGQVAEAFSRFTGSLTSGEPVVSAWAELRSDLAEGWKS